MWPPLSTAASAPTHRASTATGARPIAATSRCACSRSAATKCSGPWRSRASSASEPQSGLRQRHAALFHVLAGAVTVGRRAHLVRLEEQHLRHAFIGVDLGGQRRGVGKLQRHVPLPFRLERGYVDDYAAARESAFADRDDEDVAGNSEVLDRARQRKRVGRDDADIAVEIDEALLIEGLRVDDGGVDVGKDLELARAAHIVAVARGAVRDDAAAVDLAYLLGLERLDHRVLARHAPDPVVGL